MLLKELSEDFSVIQVETFEGIDCSSSPLFFANTEDELSVVLPTKKVPKKTLHCENDWRAFKFEAVLDFGLVGILAKISTILAENKISIFALSTYNTDYILVKKKDVALTKQLLILNHYEII